MRIGVIQRIVSRLLGFAALSLVVPLAVSIAYGEVYWYAYLCPLLSAAALAVAVGRLPAARSAPADSLRRREGLVSVVLGWLILVFFSSIAYQLTGAFAGFAECFFESMSGYTTTGATVAVDVEALPKSVLFQRSFSHWIGGMGIIVLSVAILPELAVGGMQLFSAESSGFEADKLAPRIAATARRLWVLYFTITLLECALLMVGGLSGFDAVNHAMATIATGGFSTKNASIAAFDSLYVEGVVVVFMFVSGISFALQYRAIVQAKPQRLLCSSEVRLYTAMVVVSTIAIAVNILLQDPSYTNVGTALRDAAFQTVSVVTTTGFATHDFDTWPDFSRWLLVILMLVGGCAGSTSGGSKVARLHVVAQHSLFQLRKLVRPRLVQPITLGNRSVPQDTTDAILGFYLLYITAIGVIGLAMTALGLDFVSGTTAAVSAINSIGPGLGTVGAAEPFADVPALGLYALSFGMLLGRLEIYTVLVLFIPHFWRRG